MALFTWDENLSVAVQVMDEQHRHLFKLLNRIEDVFRGGGEEAAIGQAIDRLSRYVEVHCSDEERLLGLHGYPGLKRQKLQHLFFTGQVSALHDLCRHRNVLRFQSLLDFLRGWLSQHIFQEDRKYGAFLESAAAESPDAGSVTVATAATAA